MLPKLITTAAALGLSASLAQAQYPEHELLGVVMWGAGGATDTVARAINPAAEDALGETIVVQNKPGGVGAIAVAFVKSAAPDGYTLLYGAENPLLHPVMGISKTDYSSFYPVNILGRSVGVITVPAESDYQTISDLLTDIEENPGEVQMGSTGPGGLPSTVSALIGNSAPFDVTAVPFDGEGPGLTAMLGGEVDFMPTGLSAAAQQIKAGKIRALAVVNGESVESLPDVPPITDTLPSMSKYLPWGPFYGVFVRDEVAKSKKETLVSAFHEAAKSEKFRTLMDNRGNIVMDISGAEAEEFLDQWQQVTAWALQDTGAAKVSPEKVGIPRP